MKVAVAFVMILAGVVALPQAAPDRAMFEAAVKEAVRTNDARLVDGIIINIIDNFTQRIRDAGLDPLYLEGDEASFAIVEDFVVGAGFSELLIEGISYVSINRINFSLLTLRLTMDISLPRIHASVAEAAAGVEFGKYGFYGAELGGSLTIVQPRITANARVGIIPSITVREIDVTVSLENINSALTLKFLGIDISHMVNNLLNVHLLNLLHANSVSINSLVNRIVVFIIDLIL